MDFFLVFVTVMIILLMIGQAYRMQKMKDLKKEVDDAKKKNAELTLDQLVDQSNKSRGITGTGEDPKEG